MDIRKKKSRHCIRPRACGDHCSAMCWWKTVDCESWHDTTYIYFICYLLNNINKGFQLTRVGANCGSQVPDIILYIIPNYIIS